MSLTCLSISELNKEENSRIEQNVSEWILQFLLLACNGKLGPDTCSSMWYGGALCGSRVRLGKNDLRSWNQKQKIILEAKNHQVMSVLADCNNVLIVMKTSTTFQSEMLKPSCKWLLVRAAQQTSVRSDCWPLRRVLECYLLKRHLSNSIFGVLCAASIICKMVSPLMKAQHQLFSCSMHLWGCRRGMF